MNINIKIKYFSLRFLIIFTLTIFVSWFTKLSYIGTSSLPKVTQRLILFLASMPESAVAVLRSFRSMKTIDLHYYDRINVEKNQFNWDPGYILVSKSAKEGHDVIGLLDLKIAAFIGVHTNRPNDRCDNALLMANGSDLIQPINKNYTRAYHPLIVGVDQLIYINGWNSLSSIDIRSGKEMWRLNGSFHHSIEIDENNDLVLCASQTHINSKSTQSDIETNLARFEDNLIVKVSLGGEIKYAKSVFELLMEAGLEYLVFGTKCETIRGDPFHLNQVTPVVSNLGSFRKGQLLISLRNLSLIVLFDPYSNKVIWYKSGPWMNQHCTLIRSEDSISMLDNHSYVYQSPHYWVSTNWNSSVKVYNFSKSVVDDVLPSMKKYNIRIGIEGRAYQLSDENWLIEDSSMGSIFIFDKEACRFKWVNRLDDEHAGVISWSRPVGRLRGESIIQSLHASKIER